MNPDPSPGAFSRRLPILALGLALTLALTACGGGGGSHHVNAAPVAVAGATPTSGIASLVVDFDGSASTDSDGSVAAWAWDFGDGGTGTGSAVQHTYTAAGTYHATLTVVDDLGKTGTATVDITVGANTLPVAVIKSGALEGFAPFTVPFDGSASSDADGPIAHYAWDFGNGDVSEVAAPAAIYATHGQYTAQLTVTDGSGGTATGSVTVYVAAPGDIFRLAGAISLPGSLYADCDTAGATAPGCNNGVAAGAQSLPSPATVGGYADISADAVDYYRVSFAGGEKISLAIADSSPTNDLDLKLYDAGTATLVAQSANANTPVESLVVPAAGDYLVRVDAVAGKSNYVLTIGTGAASVAGSDASETFVPGEYIVQFSQARIPWRDDAQAEARGAELGMDALGGNAGTPMLLRERGVSHRPRHGIDAAGRETMRRLRGHADVASVEPNRLRPTLGVNATDTYYPLQWNLPLAHFPAAWEIDPSVQGNGAVVAVVDTGVLPAHPDLAGQLTADGYDFVSDVDNANDGDGIDADPTDPGGDGVGRSTFHGTHVTGIIAANTHFDSAAGNTGIAGAAPQVKVMPVRAVGRYGATSYDVIQAILYAAGLPNASGTLPSKAADVINLSLGSTGYSQAEQDAMTAARAAGAIIVAAGGNTGTNTLVYPAAYDGVIGVGAVTPDRRRAPYSSSGAQIDIAAPGGDTASDLDGNGFPDGVLSTVADDSSGLTVYGYDFYQGTSMAAPHVAAAAAMMKALLPTLTPAAFDQLLAQGQLTRDLGAAGRDDDFGMGLLDAERALAATGTVTVTPPAPIASPARLTLGATATQALVVVDNGGGGTLQVTAAASDSAWLTVTAQSVDVDGLGSYRIDIDRTALVAGAYTGNVTFSTSAGSLVVPVGITVDSSVPAAAAGTLYLIVWDPVAKTAVAQAVLAPGTTAFDLAAVPAGTYQVYVGSDDDNDGQICDPGEACGAWTTLTEPKTFAHVRDRTDLSFNVGYTSSLGTASAGGSPIPANGFPHR